ncbi:hypothetical protein J437_LFUL011214 [Ladona fulva]|uniref:Rho-GAP domain-containing protein n=1 Tax=Ladona fulva TaxID=123851 RepID=A0A8K0KA29_LADFU|nr:hypothetical protein J437_LFUL011214 [Ladona fulva]
MALKEERREASTCSSKDWVRVQEEKERKVNSVIIIESKNLRICSYVHQVYDILWFPEQAPVFGVSLSTAVERSGCHDGVQLPLVVRDCIDYLEEHGLKVEGIHRSLGMRAKVQQLRKMYNQREEVSLSGHETSVVTSLLKQFFRELPEPVVSKTVEEAATAVGGSSSGGQNLAELSALVQQLPAPNRTILAWILTHMEHIVEQEKHNRMGLQNVSLVVGPMLMVGQRALAALFNHRRTLFGEVNLKKYKPPLSAGGPCPDTAEGIEEELAKQESLLGQIHREMNAGMVSKKREEQLWEVQRFVTNLKRKLRLLQRTHGSMHKSQEEEDSGTERVAEGHRLVKGSSEEGDDFKMNLSLQNTQQSIDEDVEESEKKEEESCDKGAEEPNVALKTSDTSRGELEKSEVGDGLGKEEAETIKPLDKPDGDEVDSKLVVEELKKMNGELFELDLLI